MRDKIQKLVEFKIKQFNAFKEITYKPIKKM